MKEGLISPQYQGLKFDISWVVHHSIYGSNINILENLQIILANN
jgi:hypothetical protein